MRSKVADRIMAKMPKETKIFADKYADIVVRISQILKEKGYTQKSLAEKLEKTPSEIHKWLSGEHNFTLRSIAKLEAELGETILEVPKKEKEPALFDIYYGGNGYAMHRNLCLGSAGVAEHPIEWQSKVSPVRKSFADVG